MDTALANSPIALIVAGAILLAAVLLGRRIDVRLGNVHAQLTPNGGASVRDAIDRIEQKADSALEQIAEMKAKPATATAIVVAPPPTPET